MDDNKKKSSWDELVQDLGANPDDAAFERKQPESQEIPPTVAWDEVEELPEPAPAPSDWGGLAASLGLEVPAEEEPETAESAARETEPPTLESPVLEEEVEPVADSPTEEVAEDSSTAEPFGGFLAPEPEDEQPEELAETSEVEEEVEAVSEDNEAADLDDDLETSEPEELPPLPSQMDQALSESAFDDDSETAESDATTDVDANGISGEAARSAFDALFADGASTWGSAFLDKPKRESLPAVDKEGLDYDPELAQRADALDATSSSEDDEDEEKPKRKRSRRRRRGGRGRKPADEQTVTDETSEESSEEASAETSEDEEPTKPKRRRRRRSRSGEKRGEAVERGESPDGELEDTELGEDEAPRRARQRHRNIPTWSEAIGMIVDANLEQRAKSPSKPQSSRGGRGRGGRRRGGRKSEGNK